MKIEQLAGYIDGRGYLSLVKSGRSRNAFFCLISTDSCVYLEALKRKFGGIIERKEVKRGGKLIWKWRLTRRDQIKRFLVKMLPFMEVKYERYKIILDWINAREEISGKMSDDFIEYTESVSDVLKSLNNDQHH